MKNKSSAFTLIELLIVIVIIGILAGVVLAVINPARQIQRSNETSARGIMAKACLAINTCLTSTGWTLASCDTETEAGFFFPGTTYGGAYAIAANTAVATWTSGTTPACVLTCDVSQPSATASTSGRVTVGANCIITQ